MKHKIYLRVYVNGREVPLAYYFDSGRRAWMRGRAIPFQRIITPEVLDYIHGDLGNLTLASLERRYNTLDDLTLNHEEVMIPYFRTRPFLESDVYRRFIQVNHPKLRYGWPTLVPAIEDRTRRKIWKNLEKHAFITEDLYTWILRLESAALSEENYKNKVLRGEAPSYFNAPRYPKEGIVKFDDYGINLGMQTERGEDFVPKSFKELVHKCRLVFPYVVYNEETETYE